MVTKDVGIWIETKRALIIFLTKNTSSIKIIESNTGSQIRTLGESKKYGRFGNQFMTFEKKIENKKNELLAIFFENIIAELKKINRFVVFGPGPIKKKFEKEILKIPELLAKFKGIHTVDKLTKNQKVAWVKAFFKTN